MFGFLFGNKIKKALNEGAVIIDVRPAAAFDQQGRIPGSINIPVDRITISVGRIKGMKKPVIICCEYGNHCADAAKMLKENGIEVYNGGSWQSLIRKIK